MPSFGCICFKFMKNKLFRQCYSGRKNENKRIILTIKRKRKEKKSKSNKSNFWNALHLNDLYKNIPFM